VSQAEAPGLVVPGPLPGTVNLRGAPDDLAVRTGVSCYHCCMAHKTDPARAVAEAVTLAPATVQIGNELGQVIGVQIVALPHCLACLSGGSGSRLIT
jgi:hypothetical protein